MFQDLDHHAAKKPERLLELVETLNQLEEEDPQKAQLDTLRFFDGLTNKKAAQALVFPSATAERAWSYARAWLKTSMCEG